MICINSHSIYELIHINIFMDKNSCIVAIRLRYVTELHQNLIP